MDWILPSACSWPRNSPIHSRPERTQLADPVLVGRALGEGLRNHDEARMRELASLLHARFMVIGSVGHDQRASFRLDMRVLKEIKSGQWQEVGRKSWPSLPLNDDRPPYQAMPALAPAIADLLPKMSVPRVAESSTAALPGRLPELQELIGSPRTVNVHVAQLLAMSYPPVPEAPAERAWIRSLRLLHSAPAGAEQRLAQARALLHLGRRPAALAALAVPRTDAEQSLRSVLDGNLPDAERHARKIADPVLRLLALVEVRDLRGAYQTDDDRATLQALQAIVPRNSDWYPFLSSRVLDEASRWGGENASTTVARFSRLLQAGELSGIPIERLLEASDGTDVSVLLARQAFVAYDNQLADFKTVSGVPDTCRWLLLDLLQVQVVAGFLGDGYATIDTRAQPTAGTSCWRRRSRCWRTPELRSHVRQPGLA